MRRRALVVGLLVGQVLLVANLVLVRLLGDLRRGLALPSAIAHFGDGIELAWATAVVATAAWLVAGRRPRGAGLLLGWSVAHLAEHVYLFAQWAQVARATRARGIAPPAIALPGILGNAGWLDQTALAEGWSAIRRLPFVTTADRVDTHLVWESVALVLLAWVAAEVVFGPRRTATTVAAAMSTRPESVSYPLDRQASPEAEAPTVA